MNKCVICGDEFSPPNPHMGNLPITIQYPEGEMILPMDTLSGVNEGPICQDCHIHIVYAMKEANEMTGNSFDGKDAHLND